ncbi:hypothetical protein K504DRAFT_371208 [Pleomassaria siparia CBS 279.74]|uniref:Ataxin-10 homolog n=1 Tax=Pleomassaria siparia CBS 279.74 TaxID=1314801 RepID=A0A6G1KLQ0_9PLEO|nr:hypothetical protein K504DRAFT_371208 [Pleomassaria siparia CBS 279.74]
MNDNSSLARNPWDRDGAPPHHPPNKTFYLLRSPAPIRLWTYRALLCDHALFESWRRHTTTMDDDDELDEKPAARPYLTRLRLALGPYAIHFQTPGYIKDETMRMLERDVCKKTLEQTRRNFELREELGLSYMFWDEMALVLKAAIPSLERRSFAAPDPVTPEYEGLSGPLIASYSPNLLKDLERLNQLVSIARNVLIYGVKTQNLSAERMFDKDIFMLINVCVRVTARGYDGEAGTQDEDKWQSVINAYKKLLITCLQYLNNLIARNEQRKLMLWIELFDSHLDNELPNFADMKYKMDMFPHLEQGPKARTESGENGGSPRLAPESFKLPQQPASSPFLLFIGEVGNDVKKSLIRRGEKAGATEIASECRRRWTIMDEDERNKWNLLYADVVARYRDEITQSSEYKKVVDQHAKNEESVQALAQSINQLQVEVDRMRSSIASYPDASKPNQPASTTETEQERPARPAFDDSILDPTIRRSSPAGETDFRVTYPPSFGADILQSGKEDLLKRLEPDPERPAAALTSDVASPTSPPPEDDENDDDYDDIPGDEGRGLLTDVPLILGPTEIEVLPMIIMAGIVEPSEGQPGYHVDPTVFSSIKSMHGVRCHLLLAQDNGRNLLRELLIFVAAWDLREEELYFKFMVKIMEAILANQLLPFAYHAFRESESKDIISPAQAVIMKLLTNIFRARQARAPAKGLNQAKATQVDQGDAHMVNFLLTEFRRHIIPQTCALIFLQGQIRAGHAQPEDFPLNLWDMERMYEGVYQYLEFFAILTEHEVWKNMLSNWEVANELVTLLKELDAAIPKGQLAVPPLSAAARNSAQAQGPSIDGEPAQPVAVERPYDTTGGGTAPEGYMPSPRPYIDEAQDEPSDFEWRNLKKLGVLVLSSLVWKNRQVQDQIRPLGGIEAVLNCCSYDEHNPYIREHAIMCLRFLMEGNKENQDRIRELERLEKGKGHPPGPVGPPGPPTDPSSSSTTTESASHPHPDITTNIPTQTQPPVNVKVPDEVLDQQGYETYMDSKGQVLLRKREVKVPVISSSSSTGKGKAKLETRDPKDLELLVQQVMRDLPRVQGVRHDAEKAAALAKLDKGFDGTG